MGSMIRLYAHAVWLACVFVILYSGASSQNTKENADFKLAINLYNDGLYDLAAEQLRQFVASYPATAQGIEARFYLGLAQLQLREYEDARLTFQTFALTYQDNPKAPEAWARVGESYAAVGNHREAALAYERVKVFHPRSTAAPDALLHSARHFRLAGDPASTRRVLRIIIQEYPASKAALAARAELGRLYFEEGNISLAQNELKRVIDGDPSPEARAQALLILGNINRSLGRNDLARGNFEEIISKHRSGAAAQGAYIGLGNLLVADGKFLEAIDNFKKASAEKGDSLLVKEALINAGNAYAALNDYSNAVAHYNKYFTAFPSDPDIPTVQWKSAVVNSKAGNHRRSNELCALILKSAAPDGLKRRALLRLAANAHDTRSPAQAVQHYSAFLDQYPDDPFAPEVTLRVARLLEDEIGDFRKAINAYESVNTRFGSSHLADDALMGGARCHEHLKEFGRALQFYRDLTARFPASEFHTEAEQRIRMIETFEAKEKDAGLEKLALLLGDVVAEKDRVGLSFRLGEIYFKDLKNYQAAAAQFTSALSSGMSGERHADAMYMRARSYEYLSWKDESHRQQAIDAYDQFLRAYPADRRGEQAVLARFNLRLNSLQDIAAAEAEALAFPGFQRRDSLLLRSGILRQKAEMNDAALAAFSTIVIAYPSSPSAEEAAFRRVMIFMRNGQRDSALAAGAAFADRLPGSRYIAEVLNLTARIALETGRIKQAVQLYERLTGDFSYTSQALAARPQLAEALSLDGSHQKAITLLEQLYEEDLSNPFPEATRTPALLFNLGRAHHAAGNSMDARRFLAEFLTLERTGLRAGQAYNLLGTIFQQEGALDLAASYFRLASQAAPEGAASADVALLLYNSGNYAEAIKHYTQLLQAVANDAERRNYESRIILGRLKSDDLTGAERDIAAFTKKYRATDAEIAAFELEKGLLYYRRQDHANARKSLDIVTRRYEGTPSGPVALYWTGKVQEATGKPQDALKTYDALLKRHPRAPIAGRAHFALGNLYYHAEKWDEAIQSYRRVVDDPQADPAILGFAMSNLIETYEAAGIFDAALTLTRRYLDLFPNNEDSFDKRIKIGLLYQRLGYNDQSVLHLQTLLDEAGSDLEGELRYYIAEANYNKGDYQQAILDFLKVPYLVTKRGKIDWTANAFYMAGQSYERLGRYDQALTMYQQIVDRTGIDETFKSAARKEIDRVRTVLRKASD